MPVPGTSERARGQVRRALAKGTLTRPDACEQCGAQPKRSDRHGLDAHHVTYSRVLDVRWLCSSCHQLAHPRPPRPGSARQRAEQELLRDPRRSDAIIARLAACTPPAVGRWRHALERSGQVEAIPVAARSPVSRDWPPRTPALLAIAQGASTTAEVMQLASVSYGTAWRALSRARSKPRLADVAAACDTLTVVRTSARSTRLRVGNDLPPGYYAPPDEIDLTCCTAEWTPTGWVHDRACALRLAAR
jgi:hypothetical protein